jgi:hypothetical protein
VTHVLSRRRVPHVGTTPAGSEVHYQNHPVPPAAAAAGPGRASHGHGPQYLQDAAAQR